MQSVRFPPSSEPLNKGVWIGSLVIFPNVQWSKELVFKCCFYMYSALPTDRDRTFLFLMYCCLFLSVPWMKFPDLECVNPKAGRRKVVMALLGIESYEQCNMVSCTTKGYWKYAVSLDRHSTAHDCSMKWIYQGFQHQGKSGKIREKNFIWKVGEFCWGSAKVREFCSDRGELSFSPDLSALILKPDVCHDFFPPRCARHFCNKWTVRSGKSRMKKSGYLFRAGCWEPWYTEEHTDYNSHWTTLKRFCVIL